VPSRHPSRWESPILEGRRIVALVPAYNEAPHVGDVVRTMPEFVDAIVVIDDCSSDGTSEAALAAGDPRVTLVRHERNEGLGASLIEAHRIALGDRGDIMVVMAGDGQMDPDRLLDLLHPLLHEGYDFSKGNRFFGAGSLEGMPKYRVFGNIVLTFLTKAATGYWNMFDPQNGYTAITRRVSERIDWDTVARDYSFENDVLAQLGLMRARVKDVDIPALYGEEISDIHLPKVVPSLLRTLRRAFWRRFWLQYVARSFSPVALFFASGATMLLWALLFGAWVVAQKIAGVTPTTATVMIVVLPALVGFELMLAAFVLDIMNAPE
jgi:glycosyltransferase involved in cell wall biosynthesis